MGDLATSFIRTLVPMIVGAIVSFLASKSITLDATAAANLATFIGLAVSGLYYIIVRIVELKFPQFGILLGKAKKPEY